MTSDRVNIVIQINKHCDAGSALSILNLSLHCYCILPYTFSTLAFSGSEIYVTQSYVVLGWSSKVRCLCKFAERRLTGCVLWNHSSGLFNSRLMLLLSVGKINFQNLSHVQNSPHNEVWPVQSTRCMSNSGKLNVGVLSVGSFGRIWKSFCVPTC